MVNLQLRGCWKRGSYYHASPSRRHWEDVGLTTRCADHQWMGGLEPLMCVRDGTEEKQPAQSLAENNSLIVLAPSGQPAFLSLGQFIIL